MIAKLKIILCDLSNFLFPGQELWRKSSYSKFMIREFIVTIYNLSKYMFFENDL